MSLARNALLRASRSPWLAQQASRRAFARRAVRRFMPGEKAEDALEAARTLAARGLGTILTQLGENLTSLDDAAQVRDHYLGLLESIKARDLPSWPSVKPTQLGLDLSFEACLANLEAIAHKADATGSILWIDMEDSSYVDRTLDLYRRVRDKHQRVGLALQAYLYRTPKDLESLLPLRPIIRLVKGAYAEPPSVAFPRKRDVDHAFVELSRTLMTAAAGDGAFPIFGTHDMNIVARLVDMAAEAGVRDGQYEIHMLYGIRAADQTRLAAQGRAVKTLISYGSAWFPWYMRRLAERPANVWFVVRSLFAR
jgi:proline dehydrogenase